MLCSDATLSLRYAASMLLDDWQFRSLQAICSTIENGRTAMANVFGTGLFEYLQANSDQAIRLQPRNDGLVLWRRTGRRGVL